jgi:hypothetical protein
MKPSGKTAGDWKERIHVDTIRGDDDLQQSWQERKHSRIGGVNYKVTATPGEPPGKGSLDNGKPLFIRKAKKVYL